MTLSSRPTAPKAILLLTGKQPAGTWNGRDYPDWLGFNPVDEQTIWGTVAAAYAVWNIDVTTDTATVKPHSTIAFNVLFGNYPISGGQANQNSFATPGIGAFVFVDQLSWLAWAIARDAVHEAGHTLGLEHVGDSSGPYAAGFWMGNPFVGTPVFTQAQKMFLDALLQPAADVNRSGNVDYADALLLQSIGNPTSTEGINLLRNINGR